MSDRRLAILATHPVQYQCPLWAAVAGSGGVDVKVFFGSDFSIRGYEDAGFASAVAWSPLLIEGFDHAFSGTAKWHPVLFRAGRAIHSQLAEFGPTDVLLNAYLPAFYWQGLRWARRAGVRVHFRGDTTDVDRDRSLPVRLCRNALLRLFYSQIDSFCAVGSHSRAHYLAHGVDGRRITESPFCVDSVALEQQYQSCRHRRAALRSRLGLEDDDLAIVFSGKLIPKKDPLTLIDAVAGLPSVGGRRLKLLVMGDGPLRAQCEQRAHGNCTGRISFLGFTRQEELGTVYAACDAMALPSVRSETWGLVINEALQFGLPCIVSDRVGCKDDLVRQGLTGETFAHRNVDALRAAIVRLTSWLDGRRDDVADQCRRVVSRYSLDAAAAGIVTAVERELD
jgi:glycosyltransferase involved in cell wall biosynthesis